MWRFREGSKNKNVNNEERTRIIKKVSKTEINQYKNYDGRPLAQTKQRYFDFISKKGWKNTLKLTSKRQKNEIVDRKTLKINKITDLDL